MSTIQQKFCGICVKISLNVPPHCTWCWDEVFGTALVVFDRSDLDLVYIPMTLEFDAQWDMASIDKAPPHFASYFNSVFGIMPGQKIFTAANGDGLIFLRSGGHGETGPKFRCVSDSFHPPMSSSPGIRSRRF